MKTTNNSGYSFDMKNPVFRTFAIGAGGILFLLIVFATCCTVVDSGEVGIRFHKWSLNE